MRYNLLSVSPAPMSVGVAELNYPRAAPERAGRRVVVAIPAYNEDRYIGSLVLKLRKHMCEVLGIDDGSTDATAEVAEAAGATVFRHPRNLGKTAAVQTAFDQARRLHADVLVLLDGDSQHDPAQIDVVIDPILADGADMVV